MFSGDFEQIPYPTQRSKTEAGSTSDSIPTSVPEPNSDDAPAGGTSDSGTPDSGTPDSPALDSPAPAEPTSTQRQMPTRRSI
ncbi:hypothetical protein GCM10027280_00940 [Micromonospora polyrhachis]